MYNYCGGGILISCNKDETIEEKCDTNVIVGYSIKSKSGLKGGINLEIANALMTVENGEGVSTTYESDNTTDSSLEFSLPDDSYTLTGLDGYDEEGHKIVYLEEAELQLDCIDGGCGDVELSLITEAVPFNWETTTRVANDNSLPILPWRTGAQCGVPRDIALDIKKTDGWVMLHHTFKYINDGGDARRKYMLMYNKFTGIMRMWYWHEGATAYTDLKYAIQHLGASSMLNFNGEFALPLNIRQPIYAEYYSGKKDIPSSQGLTNETWYMFEYEFAYDNLSKYIPLTHSDLFLSTRGIDITKIELEGIETGTINGQIALTTPGANLFNVDGFDYDNSSDNSVTVGSATTTDASEWWNKVKTKLSDAIVDQLGSTGSSLASSVLNLAANPATKFLNSLIHQGLENRGSVKLSIATQIKLNGTLTNQAPVSNINLRIPGMNEETGLEFLYDETLGVFNLSSTPIVNYQHTYYHKATSIPRYFQYYSIDKSSYDFVINPKILSEITILEKNTELFFYKRYQGGVELNGMLRGIGPVNVGSQNTLIYETKCSNPDTALYNQGHEYYWFAEGGVPPVATTSYGLWWGPENLDPNSFIYYPVLDPDKRFVVKAILRFRVNATGRVVTHIKSFIPEYNYKQTISTSY